MTNKAIAEQCRLFRAALPQLLKTSYGQWVIFHDGKAVQGFDDAGAARAQAMQQFGLDGGFLIVRVMPDALKPKVMPIAAASVETLRKHGDTFRKLAYS